MTVAVCKVVCTSAALFKPASARAPQSVCMYIYIYDCFLSQISWIELELLRSELWVVAPMPAKSHVSALSMCLLTSTVSKDTSMQTHTKFQF